MATYNARRVPSRSLIGAAVVVALVIGVGFGALYTRNHHDAGATKTQARTLRAQSFEGATTSTKPSPVSVVSTVPISGATHVAPNSPITVTFSTSLAKYSPHPTLFPPIAGSWQVHGANFIFTPRGDPLPLSTITLTVPSGTHGIRDLSGGLLAKSVTQTFQIGNGSILRLQELLSTLDYSPLSWTPTGTAITTTNNAAEAQALFVPPSGSFKWINRGWPRQLLTHWKPGDYNVFTRGLVMSFEADHGLSPNGHINAALWSTLVNAVAQNSVNTGGYNYALANKAAPESLKIYHNGAVVLTTPANTGIASSPTPDGTFPVNTRLRSQVMRGTNPNGQSYADLVQYIAYFHGNDAVHYMDRADYGIPQSLGCVELPLADAAKAWPYLAYGTLVTVIN